MNEELTFSEAELAAVKSWNSIVDRDIAHWDADFKRMRENMNFVTGLQWDGQEEIATENYVCNITLKQIRQKVATLYAKDPTAEAVARERMYYQVWDEEASSLMEAWQMHQMAAQAGIPDLQSEAILRDFMQGQAQKDMTKKICKTLTLLFAYQIYTACPTFKRQMKALITRVITCGVGYVRIRFIRQDDAQPGSTPTNSMSDRQRQLQETLERMQDEGFEPTDLDPSDPRAESVKSLALSLGVSAQTGDDYYLPERIEFDFIPSTSVIPDKCCRQLTEFIGARHVTIEYPLPTEEVNAMFGVEVKHSESVLAELGGEKKNITDDSGAPAKSVTVVREILNFRDKTHFYICKGYKGYLRAPEPITPSIAGFWPIFALTFNDVENDGKEETKASIFPPSDVDLIKHPQKEWNRSRDTLRDVRNACAPKWVARKGSFTKEDLQKIANAAPNEVVEVEMPIDGDLNKLLIAMPMQKPDAAVYSTEPLMQDITMGGGMQEANIGAAQPNVTATNSTIAEQSRLTVSASNVDDTDDFLSAIAKGAGEMSLSAQGFSEGIVKRIVGPGAAWPTLNRADYVNCIYLKVRAASSGRPNRALDIANYERVAPHLIAAGANPFGVIKEGTRRLGDEIDIVDFIPIPLPQTAQPGQSQPANDQGQAQMNPTQQLAASY